VGNASFPNSTVTGAIPIIFQNANIGIREGVLGFGVSEMSILRDHFTNLKSIGVITMNYNALSVWVRDSIFDHDMNGVGNWVPNPNGIHLHKWRVM